MFKRHLALRCVLLALGISGFSTPVLAQRAEPDSFLNQQRAITELVRQERDRLSPSVEGTQFDYGGSYSFFLFLFDDGVNSSRTFRRHDLRVWSRLGLESGAHELYVRGRLSFVDFNSGDQFDDEDDIDGMNLERGYYKFDLAKALEASGETAPDFNVEFKIGRDFTQFGTGYALSTPLDQLLLRTTYRDVEVTGLIGKTIGSSQDFDQSRNPERTRRTFLGLQTKYRGFSRHEPFAYVLWQRDHNSDVVPGTVQQFDYDSFYVGLGSTGEILPRLRYSTEWIAETGTSYSSGVTTRTNNIAAWAWDIEVEYLFNSKGKPRVGLEYMFASGDADRVVSPTSTIGGNSKGFKDSGFTGFGFRDTGLSFAPRLSNIHVWRLGASFYPLEADPRFNRLQLGTSWFLYHKHQSHGAVSDPLATAQSGYLGWEMDYFANWEVTSDFSATARYGAFFPGDAFPDETTRTFLLLGFTWNF